jgi:hypothetical protein
MKMRRRWGSPDAGGLGPGPGGRRPYPGGLGPDRSGLGPDPGGLGPDLLLGQAHKNTRKRKLRTKDEPLGRAAWLSTTGKSRLAEYTLGAAVPRNRRVQLGASRSTMLFLPFFFFGGSLRMDGHEMVVHSAAAGGASGHQAAGCNGDYVVPQGCHCLSRPLSPSAQKKLRVYSRWTALG